MTAPAWVQSALLIEGLGSGSDNYRLSARDGPDNGKLSARKWSVKLGPLTQEKGLPKWGSLTNWSWSVRDLTPFAGHTCPACPRRERPYHEKEQVYSKDSSYWITRSYYTERCTECSRKMKRWQRGQRDAEEARIASICYEKDISFVTLTLPNMVGDVLENVRELKRRVASFRRRFPEDCIAGGRDYYEWTVHPDDRAWSEPLVQNVHMHGVWIMDYWKQSEMQKKWGEGIVHLKRLKGSRDAVRYATKYAGKDDVKGIRLKEGFGCLYGSARRAVLEVYAVRQANELSIAEDAQD